MPGRPDDECPFPRPFSEGFDGCQAYQPAQFVPLDTTYSPMAPVWTCGNLDERVRPGHEHRYYARCRLGDVSARTRWVETVRADRVARLRALQSDLAPLAGGFAEELWRAKGRQLQVIHAAPDASPQDRVDADAALQQLADEFIAVVEQFLNDRADALQELGLPLDACLEMVRVVVDTWVRQPSAETPVVPDAVLRRFPPGVRSLIRPGAA